MDNNTFLLIMAILFVVTIIIILLIVLNNAKKTNDLNNELSKSIYEIRSNLNRDFFDLNRTLNDEFTNFSERVNSNLIQSHKSGNEIMSSLNDRLIRIDETQKNLDDLSKEILNLQSILKDKKSRGSFGEVELYAILEAAYGSNFELYDRQYHLPNGAIADAVILGGDNIGILCIDSKFPLENYRRMYDDSLDEKSRQNHRKLFAQDVKKHLDDIHNKYLIPGVTADLAYMFIPAEAIFADLYASFPDLIDYSYKQKVYIVSPTTLMAYITAIKSIYLRHKKDEKAREIENLLNDLSVEFARFQKRSEELYKDYEDLSKAFASLNISANKISKRFDRLNNGEIEPKENGN